MKHSFKNYSKSILSNFSKRLICTTHAPRPGASAIKPITLIPGEGIGLEIADSLLNVHTRLNPPISFNIVENFSFENSEYKKNECIIKGPRLISKANSGIGRVEETVRLAKELDLFANVVHSYSIPGVKTRHKDVNIVVIRENTEGEYSGLEHEVYPGVIESVKVITREASKRIADYAFEYAYLNGRKKVTAVHKANIMKLCDGQFLEATREAAKKFPFIKYEEIIIDNCCMQLISKPNQFDVMVLPNLYGSIVANITLGITGGPGLMPGAMVGNDYALFEVGGRHPATDIAGKGIANPTAFLLCYAMMLRHLGHKYFSEKLESAIYSALQSGHKITPDIDGNSTTKEYTDEIIRYL